MTMTQSAGPPVAGPPAVEPQHLISALQQLLANANENRVYLVALTEQQAARIRELEVVACDCAAARTPTTSDVEML